MLQNPIMSDRIGKWAYVLIEYELAYEPLKSMKGQVVVDFIVEHSIDGVAEPPKLLGPHAPVLVSKTSDDYACAPHNLTGSIRVSQGPRINHLQPGLQD
jgi:hypothetical protein